MSISEDKRTLFDKIEEGYYAQVRAEAQIEEITGVELLGLSWDTYDGSFEIFPAEAADLVLTAEQDAAIRALGCVRYWVNFKDGTERYCNGERRQAARNRWDSHNNFKEVKRSDEAKLSKAIEMLKDIRADYQFDLSDRWIHDIDAFLSQDSQT